MTRTRQLFMESYGAPCPLTVHERVGARAIASLCAGAPHAEHGLRLYVEPGTGDVFAWSAFEGVHGDVVMSLHIEEGGAGFVVRARGGRLMIAPCGICAEGRPAADGPALLKAFLEEHRVGLRLRSHGAEACSDDDPEFLTDEERRIASVMAGW